MKRVYVLEKHNGGEVTVEVYGSHKRCVEEMEAYALRVDMGESDAWKGDGSKRPTLAQRAQRASGALTDGDIDASMVYYPATVR